MTVFWVVWFSAIILILIFGAVIFVGAPYVPTLSDSRRIALDLLDLKSGETLYELGCGDGSLLREAAERGIKVVGYELNPILAVISWLRTRRYGRLVKIRCGNFWKADLSKADGVFVFLLDRFMSDLDRKIVAEGKPGIKLVSHAFKVPNRKISATKGGMFLYLYQSDVA